MDLKVMIITGPQPRVDASMYSIPSFLPVLTVLYIECLKMTDNLRDHHCDMTFFV